MLTSLRIKNFRLFKELTLERCGRVNLIVGKNNSGKTCVLEALRVYVAQGNMELLKKLVRDRREDLDALSPASTVSLGPLQPAQADPLRNLFHGYALPLPLPLGKTSAIEIGPLEDDAQRVRLAPAVRSITRNVDGDLVRQDKAVQSVEDIGMDDEVFLNVSLGRGESWKLVYRQSLSHSRRKMNFGPPVEEAGFVAARPLETSIAKDWAYISVRPKRRDYVLAALHLIDPEILEIVMVNDPRSPEEQVVLVYGDDKRLSLASLGDGMTRLFEIVVATVAATGGVVLFDEFENGLHWTVQPLAWKLLLTLAKELDVQIFATTHSWDCVRAFQSALEGEGEEDPGMLFHLGRSVRKSNYGEVQVVSYTGDALRQATRAGLEVR